MYTASKMLSLHSSVYSKTLSKSKFSLSQGHEFFVSTGPLCNNRQRRQLKCDYGPLQGNHEESGGHGRAR